MANNTTKNFSQIVLKKFTSGFMSDLVLTKSIDRQLMSGAITPSTGSTIQFKRPHQWEAERTNDGDVTGTTKNQITSATATGEVGQYITVRVEYDQLEQAIELNQLDEILQPIRDQMVTTLETEVATRMSNAAALISGDPDTAITKWSDVSKGATFLTDIGVIGNNFAAIDPWSTANLADAQGGLSNGSDSLVNKAWENAQISTNFGGLTALKTNGLSTFTSGNDAGSAITVDNTPTVTYSALKDTYQLTIDLTGLTNTTGTINVGDTLEFPATHWLNQQNKQVLSRDGAAIPFTGTVITGGTANGSGELTVTISGAPIFDTNNVQYDSVDRAIIATDVVNILGTTSKVYKPSLFYNKMAFGLGTVVLPKLHSIDSSVVSVDGISIRVHKYSNGDGNTQKVRFDILPTFCVFNPLMIGKLYGNP